MLTMMHNSSKQRKIEFHIWPEWLNVSSGYEVNCQEQWIIVNWMDSLYWLRKINCGILLLTNPNILVFSLSHFPLFIKYYLLLKVSLKVCLFKKHWLIDIPFPKESDHPHLNSDCSCFLFIHVSIYSEQPFTFS